MMAKVACAECHGDATRGPVADVAQENCDRCHEDKYTDAIEEWQDYAGEVLDETAERLDGLRDRATAAGGEAAKAFAVAQEMLDYLRRANPVHNVLLLEHYEEALDEAASACEDALGD